MRAIIFLTVCFLAAALSSGKWVKSGAMNRGLEKALGQKHQSHLKDDTDKWFVQRLDHFDPQNTATFNQRYMVNATYYQPNGPVFVLLGGESATSDAWLRANTEIMLNAQQFNASVVQLEHRFYGKSQPFPDLSNKHLRYLSSEQALADAAAFISSHQKNMTSPAKYVVFGGSYSGALAAWFRLKYPQLASGAVATSAPVLASVNFPQYQSVVIDSLRTAANGAECISNIAAGTAQVTKYMESNKAQLVKDFKICDSDLSNDLDIQMFYEAIANNFDDIVQYNKDNRAFEGATNATTIDEICSLMGSSYQGLIDVNNFILSKEGEQCLNVSYNNFITMMNNIYLDSEAAAGGRQWTYQTCAEFGYYQTSDNTSSYFGDFKLSLFTQQCYDIYGINPADIPRNVDWTNSNYGGKNITSSNIVFPNGSIDPWHILSLTDSTDAGLPSINIVGTAHCANMYPPSDTDPQSLKLARATITANIAKYIV